MRMPTTKKLSAAVDYTKTYTSAINCVKLIITFYRSPLYKIDRNIFFTRSTFQPFFTSRRINFTIRIKFFKNIFAKLAPHINDNK